MVVVVVVVMVVMFALVYKDLSILLLYKYLSYIRAIVFRNGTKICYNHLNVIDSFGKQEQKRPLRISKVMVGTILTERRDAGGGSGDGKNGDGVGDG